MQRRSDCSLKLTMILSLAKRMAFVTGAGRCGYVHIFGIASDAKVCNVG